MERKTSTFYVKPRGEQYRNTCAAHNPGRGRKHLRKAQAKLLARQQSWEAGEQVYPGPIHKHHKPGSMKS